MSIGEITTLLAYGTALIGIFVSKTDTGKIKWAIWAVLILLAHIAVEVTP